MAEQIDILQKEVDKMRENMHSVVSEVTGLKISVQMLEDRKVCDSHGGFVGKLETICINTEVIKTNIENIDKRINGSIQEINKHIEESKPYREMTIIHDQAIKGMKGMKAILVTTLITLVLSVVGVAVTWGEIRRQVMVNTMRLDKIENAVYAVNAGKRK